MMTQDSNVTILVCLRKQFDPEIFAKFQRVIDFLGEELTQPLYTCYDHMLKKKLTLVDENNFPNGYSLGDYAYLTTKYMSFRFIGQLGRFILDQYIEGSVKAEEYLIKLIKILIYHALISRSDTANFALVELEQLCALHKITLPELYQKYRRKLLKVVIKAILKKLEKHIDENCSVGTATNCANGNGNGNGNGSGKGRGNCVAIYMHHAFEIFNVSTILIQDIAQSLVIITYLISKDRYLEPSRLFLQHLATFQKMDVAQLLRFHIQAIMVSILLEGKMSSYDLTESLKKLCVIADRKNPHDLLETKLTNIKGRILLNYSIDRKKTTDAIFYLSTWEASELDRPFEDQFDDESFFIEYLSPTMVGILLGIDSHFSSSSESLKSKESLKHIESLATLISKLDLKLVATIHHKLLSTLSLILRLRPRRDNEELNLAIIGLWENFIKRLSKSLKDRLIINICVALYDLIEDCPQAVSRLYILLLCGKNSTPDVKKLETLSFIPNAPGFESIYKAIKPFVGNSKSTLAQLESAIDCVLPLTKLENRKGHVLAVTRIRDLCKSNQKLLMTSMLSNLEEPLNKVVSKTIESLLALLSTEECSALIAECLGIIGAINPVRLTHLVYGDIGLIGESENTFIRISSEKFVVRLIEKLKNSLLSDRRSETASYALQEVVNTYNVYKTNQILSQLTDEARKACDICRNTNYAGTRRTAPDMSVPLYIKFKNEGQYSYKEWLDKFFLVLISLLEDDRAQCVLHACAYNFKDNLKLAEYLLPIVITNIILCQSTSLDIIEKELMAIITDDIGVSSQDLDTVYRSDFEHSLQTLHFQCANIVFCLLDNMTAIDKNVKLLGISKEQLLRWHKFGSSLPKDKLAILASKCRAYARSLFYFDQYYFEIKNWNWKQTSKTNEFDKYWTSLQRVFMALDDIHEAAGIQMRRTSPTTVTDDIANLESAGRFDKAILHYESLLDITNHQLDKKQLLEDSLKCLANLGHHQRLYERSKQLIDQYPQFKKSILPTAVEAFWKLGKWDELDNTLKNESHHSIFDSTPVCQGILLNSLISPGSDTLDQLKIVKETSIKPLSIAMIDRSAYFRGYQNLLVLHGIEDFALALEVIHSKHFQTQNLDENTMEVARIDMSERLKNLFSTWNKRNRLVQPSIRSLEPLLAWQRSIGLVLMQRYPFVQRQLCLDVGMMWLSSADTAREARCFDRSFYSLVQAQKWFGPDLLKSNLDLQVKCTVVQAKLHWYSGESTEAIKYLNAAVHRLQNHALYQHLESRKSKNVDARRKTNNPYQHPDDELYPDISSEQSCDDCGYFDHSERESFARLKLLLTRYTEEAAAVTPRSLLAMYEDCVHLGENQEEVFLLLARYYDKLANYYTENPDALRLEDKVLDARCDSQESNISRIVKIDKTPTARGRSKSSSQEKKDKETAHKEDVISKLMEQSILAFGNSLKHGVRYLEESMPRMLNIWFDLGSKKCLESMAYYPRAINSRIESTVRMVDTLLLRKDQNKGLPSYYFISALSLLLSRVCHPHHGICEKTSKILEQLLVDYPHQMMWRLAAMQNDENPIRKQAAENIINRAIRRSAKLDTLSLEYKKFIDIMGRLCKNFTELAKKGSQKDKKQTKPEKKISGGNHPIRDIEPMCEKFIFRERIIAPIQSSINPLLPTENDYNSLKEYNIYPDQYMTFIRAFGPDAYVFNSMQQPRKVDLYCENGKKASILCKSMDDLRKDSRCMEFFNLLNRILRRGSQSSARFFEIATFLVVPLESQAGIIEMVPNVDTLRSIVEKLYRDKHGPSFQLGNMLKKRNLREANTDAEVYHTFVEKAMPRVTPPVFQHFFHKKFPEPISWYMARQAYSRSLALASMVGYIVGLGDRHLDNVLIDIKEGRVVHVDMNLLFHQADGLPVPEVVPFRLTHNVVAALGPNGTEGSFRKFSEIAMRVMREEKELLLTTLKPFLHDPCCEWKKEREANRGFKEIKQPALDGSDWTARWRIEVVEKKLKGFPRPGKENKPLTVLNAFSVEAQVDILIEEATDVYALSQMYHGWSPHI